MSENNKKNKLISDKNNTYFTENRIMRGSSIPTEGTYLTGDMIINDSATSVDEPIWICNEGGTPGVWSSINSTSTTIVPSYDAMLKSKASVGSLFYVTADESDEGRPGFFIITSVQEDENGKKIPATWDKINKKESSVPSLTYDSTMPEGTRIYLKDNQDLIIRFNFSSITYGDGKYRVYRDGSLVRAWTGAKGAVMANLGPITTDGTYEITVTATDYLTIPAPETLTFKVIVGGLKLSSTFEETLLSAIYEEGDVIEFPYKASLADSSVRMKLKLNIEDINTGMAVAEDILDLEGTYVDTVWTSQPITKRGLYRITAQAYTGESVNDATEGNYTSGKLEYQFRVLAENEIAIIDELKNIQYDSNMYFSIPFRTVSKIADYFVMRGIIEKNINGEWVKINETSDTGISCRVNVTNYWSVGKLEAGEYKYTLKAYTVDGLVETRESAVRQVTIVESTYQKVPYIDNANLIAYFDANTKRNNDGSPEIWSNSAKTGDKYRILLHGLNFTSNGWKHVDETLGEDEDGETMLKFTGESYGEMVEMVNGRPVPYSPFNIFKMSGQQGITIETAIRTRNIGELNARVLTCMKSDSLGDPGVAISYNTMAIASDSQVNKLEFVEDEWVHITLVVDNDIRKVGQDIIEDDNPAKTIRIYINGVLCSCTTQAKEDGKETFLDGSKQSYPLVLNCCRMIDAAGNVSFSNFGECEIKFIRIYNNYLKSSEVLQNYISHIYDSEEQQHENDKNNTDLATLPTIVFKRKGGEEFKGNAKFATLHSIKDKKESKKTFVDCVMEYDDGEGNIIVYDNVDVYLQGTSSLQYPVKNYKIKSWVDQEKTSKFKFVPPNKDGEWVADNCYTLKCDYMEQSHKNNTPTARFYNQVIDALGGMSPAKRDGYHDAIDGFPCIVYYNEGEPDSENILVGSFMFNIDKEGKELGFECDLYDEHGEKIGSGKDSCISYEATANASDTAGCFYKLSESIENVYKYYLEDSYKEYIKEYGLDESKFTIEDFKEGIENGTISYMTFDEFVSEYDEIDYIMNDFEARYTFNEDDENATYRPMVDLVNWVSESIEAGTFKKDFEAHLDLNYTLAYYLQMQVFTQVDNCGKNSMWDTWDGVKFYPRPYDMDTQMGLSNTGTEIIRVDSEILVDMSPTTVDGTFAGYYHTDTTTDLRYMNYNTRTSKLWNAFAKEFKEEIKSAYTQLRNAKVYDYDNIIRTIWADTDDVIGKVYFNKDASSKYLSQTTPDESTYLQMLHGNRAQKYKKFLKERLIFLDTIFDYKESSSQPNSLNSAIGLRSDAAYGQGEGTTVRCYLGISTYSPQYVTISIGSGADGTVTAYVGPESTYEDPDTGIEQEGTLFSFPIRGINKEFTITGAGNIKRINKLQSLNLTEARIEKAIKLLELDVSYSNRMSGLKVGNNTYLRSLNCTNSYLLGTATESQMLDLSNCKNLKTLNIAYTKFTGITFPQDTVLNSINLLGSSVKNVSIDGAEFLNDINITGCDNINKFELNRCNKITSVNVSNSTIQNFIVTNCKNVTDVNLSGCKSINGFDVTNSYNIVTLNMSGNTSPIMQDLKLYSMYNLNKLIVSKTTSLHNIRLPKYLNEEEASKALNGDPNAKLWNKLTYLDVSESSLKKIQYGSADVPGEVVDLGQLDQLSTLKINYCTSFTEILNINYKGDLRSLFTSNTTLVKITGTLTNTTNSINSMFSDCHSLNNIDGLNMLFTGVTSADSTCYRAKSMKTPGLMKILKACGSSLNSVNSFAYMYGMSDSCVAGSELDTTRELPANFFEFNPNITSAGTTFGYTRYTSVHGDLLKPMAEKIQNISQMFFNNTSLQQVGNAFLQNKPKLTNVKGVFQWCKNLTRYIDAYPNIFVGSPNITTTFAMFDGCNNLLTGDLGLGDMLDPLTNLTTTAYMFHNCTNNFAPVIKNGFLAKNTKLTEIDGMFQSCTKIPTLPESLFRPNIGDINISFPYLTTAIGLFGGCTSMEGVVSSRFFLGAEEIKDIGKTARYNTPGGGKYPSKGIFSGSQITGYYDSFLQVLPKLQDVSGMFEGCSALRECYYYKGNLTEARNNSVSSDLLTNNILVTSVESIFSGCSRLEGHIPGDIFDSCKNNITTAKAAFKNCTTLSGANLDSAEGERTDISENWFKGAKLLANVSEFIMGCSGLSGDIPASLFEGCEKLAYVNNFMQGCVGVEGSIPVELFDSCRSTLTDVSHFFNGCTGLTGKIPVGEYETIQGIISYDLVSSSEEGAMRVVSTIDDPFKEVAYSDVVNLSPNLATIINASGNYFVKPVIGDITKVHKLGLLSDCINLVSASKMFNDCRGLTGGIPHDLFLTSSHNSKYTKLTDISGMFTTCWGLNDVYTEEQTGIKYICSPQFLDKCPALTNISSLFYYLGNTLPACEIHPQMFDKQTKLESVDWVFGRVTKLTGGITQLFKNSISTLTSAKCTFAYTNITSVGNTFLNNGGMNKKLKYVYSIFQGCTNLQGTAPEFWNGNKFTALDPGTNGYWGALANCTQLTNYETARNISENWVKVNQI